MAVESVNAAIVSREKIAHKYEWRKKVGVCIGLILSAFAARAEAPPPPREFWDYLMEFGDDKGDVFDPSDFAAVTKMPAKAQGDSDKLKDDAEAMKSEKTNAGKIPDAVKDAAGESRP